MLLASTGFYFDDSNCFERVNDALYDGRDLILAKQLFM